MIPQMPKTIHQAWGEPAARDFTTWLEGVLADKAIRRDEWAQVVTRLDVVERDLGEVKTDVRDLRREMNARFDAVQERFDRMNENFNARFDRMNEDINTRFDRTNEGFNARFDELHGLMAKQTRWTIGVLTVFAAMITALLAAAQFAP